MTELPLDKIDLLILQNVCTGKGLEINLRYLSKRLNKHRNTIRERVRNLLSHRIVDNPIMPFRALFEEYPLLVAVYADLPLDAETTAWLINDPNVFAAFRVREGEYNMLLFEFHKNLFDYYMWREQLLHLGKIPTRRRRTPSEALYFSNQLILKYEPSAAINIIGEKIEKQGQMTLNGYSMDELAFKILKFLVEGHGLRINENYLSKTVQVHRATIRRRILKMQKEKIILNPLCRFPQFFVPPSLMLVFSMVEVKNFQEKVIDEIMNDPHVSLAYKISRGKYNLLLFECHESIEDYLEWEEKYEQNYPACFGSIKSSYLSSKTTISIDQQKVSNGIITEKLKQFGA
jgi:DNA-binding Lrp family transcriptional regulator